MRTNIFTTAVALSDPDLLARTLALAGKEREATAELIAHLAVLEMRPSAYAALGQGSLFGYCTEVLRLSEDAACTRIAAARWCRLFPVIADLMVSGSLSLTAVRLLGPHLTPENHEAVLVRASAKSCKEVEALVAELAPQPDLVASVRKLPSPNGIAAAPSSMPATPAALWPVLAESDEPAASATDEAHVPVVDEPVASSPVAAPYAQRPIVKASAPERYRVQFTIGQGARDELRRVQALLRREIPNGDAGLIFERALHLLLEKVEKEKLGAAGCRARRAIRLETDRSAPRSRHIPAAVRGAVWKRDAAQCAFLAPSGTRCPERNYLEFHHLQPFARQGPATVANISLRCRRHNQYEAELIFGPRIGSARQEDRGDAH